MGRIESDTGIKFKESCVVQECKDEATHIKQVTTEAMKDRYAEIKLCEKHFNMIKDGGQMSASCSSDEVKITVADKSCRKCKGFVKSGTKENGDNYCSNCGSELPVGVKIPDSAPEVLSQDEVQAVIDEVEREVEEDK